MREACWRYSISRGDFRSRSSREHRREIGERGARERVSQRLIDLHGEVVRVGLDPETSGTPAPCDDGPDDGLHRVLGIREANMVAQPTPLQKRRLVKLAEHHDR